MKVDFPNIKPEERYKWLSGDNVLTGQQILNLQEIGAEMTTKKLPQTQQKALAGMNVGFVVDLIDGINWQYYRLLYRIDGYDYTK